MLQIYTLFAVYQKLIGCFLYDYPRMCSLRRESPRQILSKVVMSLTDFEDADGQMMPKMSVDVIPQVYVSQCCEFVKVLLSLRSKVIQKNDEIVSAHV